MPAPESVAAPAANTARSPWQQLVDYHLAGVRRESLGPCPPLSQRQRWAVVPLTAETVVTRGGSDVDLGEGGRALSTSAAGSGAGPGEDVLTYGWPLLVLDDHGTARVVPLFSVELSIDDHGRARPVTTPDLEGALLDDRLVPADVAAALRSRLPQLPAPGDVDGWRAACAEAMDVLRVDRTGTPPDPDAPGRDVPRRGTLPAVHDAAVVIAREVSAANRALLTELRELRTRTDAERTAARWLITDDPSDDQRPASPQLPPLMLDTLRLNGSQEQAVRDALESPLTVVTGPPGTGKSQFVAALVVNERVRGNSVLVASTNNGAVDVAVRRCRSIDPALLVRTGNRDFREALPDLVQEIRRTPRPAAPSPAVIERSVRSAAEVRRDVLEELSRRTRTEAELARVVVDQRVTERQLWSRRPERTSAPPRWVRRAARWFPGEDTGWWTRRSHRRRGQRLLAAAAVDRATATAESVAAWARLELQRTALTEALAQLPPADAESETARLLEVDRAWGEAGAQAVSDAVSRALATHGEAVAQVATLRRGGTEARRRALTAARAALRGWGCTALSVAPNFPLEAAGFDVLVVDEASQCTLAAVLPLAYRARRIVVVGDPNQLTPVVTLRRPALERVAARVGWTDEETRRRHVSYGADSTFTAYAARAHGREHFLAEHYRCHPAIAAYVNEQFYSGRLEVLTDVSAAVEDDLPRGLDVLDVAGGARRAVGGSWVNEAQAQAVVQWIRDHRDDPGTLAVVTPFAAQAERIETLLEQEMGEAWCTAHDVVAGAAHRLQGDQRDVVLFSTVLSADTDPATVAWVEQNRHLVNVAVSRAVRRLVVVGGCADLRVLPVPTLHALLDAVGRNSSRQQAPPVALTREDLREDHLLHSEAERDLFAALLARSVAPQRKRLVEGYELDFAVVREGLLLDVEVDGVHHVDADGRRRRTDLARDEVLRQLGWTVLRFPAWRVLDDADAVAAEIAARLGAAPQTERDSTGPGTSPPSTRS
ncbi:AAA domain-containing protein [Kineococcus sp. SYSU DK003]|uniref:AAA domain-containing protein n=1 Tax=Kineococcus sp. SYSU DK003 TaxID=3383124 RepID=UPI003D7E9988